MNEKYYMIYLDSGNVAKVKADGCFACAGDLVLKKDDKVVAQFRSATIELKPCPFCGNKMEGYPDYTISFKRDKKKIYGVYHEICTLHCNRCTCTIQQAGASKEEAERNVSNVWNKRAERKEE